MQNKLLMFFSFKICFICTASVELIQENKKTHLNKGFRFGGKQSKESEKVLKLFYP